MSPARLEALFFVMNDPTSPQIVPYLIQALRRNGIAYTSSVIVLFVSGVELFAGTTAGFLEVLVLGALAAFVVVGVCTDARGRYNDMRVRMSKFVGEVERRNDKGNAWETVHGFELRVGDVSAELSLATKRISPFKPPPLSRSRPSRP